jgi:hypothetical protein
MKPRQPERNHSDAWIWLNALLAAGNRRQNGGMDIDIVESGKNRKHVRRIGASTLFLSAPRFPASCRKTGLIIADLKKKICPAFHGILFSGFTQNHRRESRLCEANVRSAVRGLG